MDSLVEIAIATILGGGLFQAIRALLKLPSDRDVSVAEAYSKLVADMRRRVEDLEQDLAIERKSCAEAMVSLNAKIAALEERIAS